MARTRKKTAGANIPVPQNDASARNALREIGELNRDVMRIEAAMNDEIAALQDKYGAQVAPLKDEITAKTEGLKMYCEVNRDRLTRGGKVKFHNFATGTVSWRVKPPRVTIRGADAVIDAIKAAGMKAKFIRVKETVNKEAMLDAPEKARMIPGVSIGSEGEDFIVEPSETDLKEE